MLYQQYLEAIPPRNLFEEEIDMSAHRLDIFILFASRDGFFILIRRLRRKIRAADLVEHKEAWHRCIHLAKIALQTAGERNMNSQIILIRANVWHSKHSALAAGFDYADLGFLGGEIELRSYTGRHSGQEGQRLGGIL